MEPAETGFAASLFQGRVRWPVIHPMEAQSREDREAGDAFLKKVRDFLKANLDPDEVDVTREIPPRVMAGLRDLGAFAVRIPKEYGGLGLSESNYSRFLHLLASYCGSTTGLMAAHQSIGAPQPLMLFGTEAQKKKYLPLFAQGAIAGFALTEPEAGSDPRRIKTTATPVGNGDFYLLQGEKLWCTNGNIADVLVVMALTPSRTVEGKAIERITAFIVETKTKGFEVAYRCKFMGLNAIQNGVLKFDQVKVPKENILLGEGEGLKVAFQTLNFGRVGLAAASTGMSKWCLRVSRSWAKERKQWGAPIGEHEAVASKIASMAGTVFAMNAVTRAVTRLAESRQQDFRIEAAMAKLFCTEKGWEAVNHTLQIRGGRGFETKASLQGRGVTGYPVERVMRDSRINTILEGTSEIMSLFIGREALSFYLNRIQELRDPKPGSGRKTAAVFRWFFSSAAWYGRSWLPSLGGGFQAGKPLDRHVRFVQSTAKRLARVLFHKVLFDRGALARRQNLLKRVVDIGTGLFAISCTCVYAQSLSGKPEAKEAVELADLFCGQERKRIAGSFRDISRNEDRPAYSLARKIVGGDYAWLEDDIIF